jgi:peptidoglycan/LPS O-acetylase OafA/YrhL
LAYNLPFLNNFGKYGDFTYGVYIFHFPIIQIFKQYDLFEKFNPYISSLMILSLTLLLAYFSWFFIEVKFLDRYKNKFAKC